MVDRSLVWPVSMPVSTTPAMLCGPAMPSTTYPLLIAAAQVVQQQLDAYNAKDIDALVATYAEDAEQYLLHAGVISAGRVAIRQRMVERFNDNALHAQLVSRTVMDNIVVDHEFITRTFPDGLGTVEMICIYEVHEGKIAKATFAIGQARPKK